MNKHCLCVDTEHELTVICNQQNMTETRLYEAYVWWKPEILMVIEI